MTDAATPAPAPAPAPAPSSPTADADGAEPRAQTVQIVRTVPERIYGFAPRGEFRILEAYRRALRSAQRLIYIENQFVWSPHIVEILAAKLRDPPHDRFRLVVLLPSRPNNGADSTRGQLGVRTVFNFLGPLANPAKVKAQAVGVADARMAPIMAGVFAGRGHSSLVFRGDDGLDGDLDAALG